MVNAAVAAGGVVLGHTDLPDREDFERFEGDVTLLVIALYHHDIVS